MKKKAILSSILTIALCLSLIAGSTFALFTSESQTNIAVTSGKVDVIATIDEDSVQTKALNDTEYMAGKGHMYEAEAAFSSTEGLIITNMLPGDGIAFNIDLVNNSTVTVKYRTIITLEEAELLDGLKVMINGVQYRGETITSVWEFLKTTDTNPVITVSIELPDAEIDQSRFQGKTLKFNCKVEAVQGNANVDNTAVDPDTTFIYDAADLIDLAAAVNNGSENYAGKTVKLMSDIDLSAVAFSGIGWKTVDQYNASRDFSGTFDGQGHTIRNMTVSSSGGNGLAAAALFNCLGADAVIKNLNIDNANVTSSHYAAAIVGYMGSDSATGSIENCNVTNSSIVSAAEQIGSGWDNGDKVGGIAGYICNIDIYDCSVKNTSLRGVRDMGGIVGCVGGHSSVEDCEIENVSIARDASKINVEEAKRNIGSIVGRIDTTHGFVLDQSGNTGEAAISEAALVSNAAELKTALTNVNNSGLLATAAKTVILTADIDMSSWTAVDGGTNYWNLTLDGNGHKLMYMADSLFSSLPAKNYIFKDLAFTDVDITADTNAIRGAIVGLANANGGGSYTITDCHINGGSITATQADAYVGGFIGFIAGYPQVTFTDCDVTDVTLSSSEESTGAFIGHNYADVTMDNCAVKGDTSVTCDVNRNNGAAKAGYFVGTVCVKTVAFNNCTVDADVTLSNNNAQAPLASGFVGRTANSGSVKVNGCMWIADGVSMNVAGEYLISNAAGLQWFNDQVNKEYNSFGGKTVKLTANIDFGNRQWLPVGQNVSTMYGDEYRTVEFRGTFDGQNHNIYNIRIEGLTKEQVLALPTDDAGSNGVSTHDIYSVGFFGYLMGKVENLIITDATVIGYHNVGTIAGYTDLADGINNCHVERTIITATHISGGQCGDKVGGIVGMLNASVSISGCTVEDITITAGRDAGAVVGCAQYGSTVANCSATTGVNMIESDTCGHSGAKNISADVIGRDLR